MAMTISVTGSPTAILVITYPSMRTALEVVLLSSAASKSSYFIPVSDTLYSHHHSCNGEGHFSKDCPEPKQMGGGCFNCGEEGHNKADCPNPRKDNRECFNCGEVGHSKADCPNPKVDRPFTGECFNCGETGHSKADCTNPKVERPFTGTCNHCGKEGHRIAECPDKPPTKCRNCLQEGHKTTDCENARKIDRPEAPDVTVDQAWELLKKASDDPEQEVWDFKRVRSFFTAIVPAGSPETNEF